MTRLNITYIACLIMLSGCAENIVPETTKTLMTDNVTISQIPYQETSDQVTRKKIIKSMSQVALLKLLNNEMSGYTLLDVRTPQEYAEGHIQGAVNISHEQILQNISSLDKYKNTHLIVYCRSGRRAGKVTDLLEQQSYLQDIYHLDGDILGWQKAGLELVD